MTKIYLRLEVDFDDDADVSKLLRYGRDSRAMRDLLVGAWRYCKRNKTDGHLPTEQVGKLVYPDTERNGIRDADRLIECGMAERTPDGYFFPGFLKHNKSRAEIDADAKRKAEAGYKGGKASGLVRKGEADTKQGASPPRSHSSETETKFIDRDKDKTQELGGKRPETLRTEPAPNPPQTPDQARCTNHRGVAEPGPCKGCQAARERAELTFDRESDKHSRLIADAVRRCPDCNGSGVREDETGKAIGKCSHPRVRVAS